LKIYKFYKSFKERLLIRSIHIEALDTLPRYVGLLGMSKKLEDVDELMFEFNDYTLRFDIIKSYILDRTFYYEIEDKSGFYYNNVIGRNWFFQTGTSIVEMLTTLIPSDCVFEGVNGVLGNPLIIGRSVSRRQAIQNIINDLCLDVYYTDKYTIREIPFEITKTLIVDVWSENYTSGKRDNSITVSGVIRGGAYNYTLRDYEDIAINGESGRIYETRLVCDRYNLERLAQLLMEKQSRYEYSFKLPTQDIKVNDLLIIKNRRLNQAKKIRVTKITITGNMMEVTGAYIAS